VGDSEAGITLSGDTASGAGVSGDGGTLVYAHGQHDVLLTMAQGQTAMTSAFSALGDGSMLTYLPYTAHMALATETVGVPVPATYDPVTGTLTPTGVLGEGPHSITYGLTDDAGNASGQSPALNLTIDTSAPDTPSAAPASYWDNTGSIQSTTSSAATTDDSTPGVNIGGLPAGASSAYLYVDGIKVSAQYDAATGTLTPTAPLGAGLHSITYSLVDAAGNESGQSPALGLTVDTSAPNTPAAATTYVDGTGSITSTTSSAATTDETRPGVNIGALPGGATAYLYVDGVKVAATYDAVTGTLTPTAVLGEGPHSITYSLTNAAGTESAQSPALNLTIDTTAPATPGAAPTSYADNVGSITSATSSAATTDDTTPGINIGSLPAGASGAFLYVDGARVAATYDAVTGTLTPTVALTDGAHTLRYSLTDAAGNESGQSPAFTLTLDTSAPAAPVIATVTGDNTVNATEQGAVITGTAEAFELTINTAPVVLTVPRPMRKRVSVAFIPSPSPPVPARQRWSSPTPLQARAVTSNSCKPA
jgi:hypothetical protein